jgi:hypothetical protein
MADAGKRFEQKILSAENELPEFIAEAKSLLQCGKNLPWALVASDT